MSQRGTQLLGPLYGGPKYVDFFPPGGPATHLGREGGQGLGGRQNRVPFRLQDNGVGTYTSSPKASSLFDYAHSYGSERVLHMQSLGRPMALSVLGRAGRAVGASPKPGAAVRDLDIARQQPVCLRCQSRALRTTPLRFFSSPPPPPPPHAGPTKGKESASHKEEPEKPSIAGVDPRDLPSTTQDKQQGTMKEKFSQLMDRLQNRSLDASHTINDLTGYSLIEAIKAENAALEISLAEAHTRLRSARQSYKSSNAKRAATQREVTTLLARKESWSPSDLERFTELYRTDHVLEGEVSAAQEKLTEAEAEEQGLSQRLNSGILKRYHEEQIWSDKIRRASTWGTWGLMGMNFLLFVVLQFVAEPWRRKRLVRGVVAEEKEVLAEVREELAAVKLALEAKEAGGEAASEGEALDATPSAGNEALTASVDDVDSARQPGVTWREFLAEPARWQRAVEDLYSERRLQLRMRDVSALALEGAAVGAAVAGSIAWAVVRRN